MVRGEVISYIDLSVEEGFSIQRGMNFNINGKDYGIILMSVRANAPYADKIEDNGRTIIYEGHDIQSNHNDSEKSVKYIDQPMRTPNGTLTENGKFYKAAQDYKAGKCAAKKIKVYEKIKSGVWVYNGYFNLTDAFIVNDGNRNVFKFKLEVIDDEEVEADSQNKKISELILEHNRLIPTEVKVAVYARDKGRCVKCGSNKNLHYDHILPFSKGGSSTTPDNIQLLCATCNLKKHDHIEWWQYEYSRIYLPLRRLKVYPFL